MVGLTILLKIQSFCIIYLIQKNQTYINKETLEKQNGFNHQFKYEKGDRCLILSQANIVSANADNQ